jgi:membrane protein YqaA with SNARE-associated domain
LIKKIIAKYTAFFISLMKAMGFWGVLGMATMDAALFGVPMDPIVGSYVYHDRERFWLYILMAAAGSAAGSLVPYWIGRAGGELLLLKRIDRRRLEAMRDKFEKQEFFFLAIPALLPPPTPFKLFVACSGVFEMRIPLFLLSVFTGRVVRFLILSMLVMVFGEQVVHVFGSVVL